MAQRHLPPPFSVSWVCVSVSGLCHLMSCQGSSLFQRVSERPSLLRLFPEAFVLLFVLFALVCIREIEPRTFPLSYLPAQFLFFDTGSGLAAAWPSGPRPLFPKRLSPGGCCRERAAGGWNRLARAHCCRLPAAQALGDACRFGCPAPVPPGSHNRCHSPDCSSALNL